jgi:protein-tyrosine phosphatase
MSAPDPQASGISRRRVIALEGALNFRDLGGYRGADGRRIRWGHIYRSGTTSRLTPAGIDAFGKLGVRIICDLRSTRERREPSMLTGRTDVTYWVRDHDLAGGDLPRLLLDEATTADAIRARMIASYGELAFEYGSSFSALFEYIADGAIPLVFNCSAGKDRTGIAAALLLSLLGVSRRTMLRDYRYTENILRADREAAVGTRAGLYAHMDGGRPDVVAPLLRADGDYLSAAFAAIEQRSGSVHGYLSGLGVTPQRAEKIRELLMTPRRPGPGESKSNRGADNGIAE